MPVNKLDNRNTTTSKKKKKKKKKKRTKTFYRQVAVVIAILQIYDQIEQFESWIPGAWSIILRFSLIANVYLRNTEKRNKHL